MYFPTYHITRPLVSKKTLYDKGKPVIATTFETQKNQVKSSIEASIMHEIQNLEYMTNTLKEFRSIPLAKDLKRYYAWLEKVYTMKSQFKKE